MYRISSHGDRESITAAMMFSIQQYFKIVGLKIQWIRAIYLGPVQ